MLPDALDIRYAVLVVGDRYARDAIRKMAGSVIDDKLFRLLMLGLPNISSEGWNDLIETYEGNDPPYAVLCRPEMYPLLEAVFSPSPETIAGAVDEDLRDFYARLYSRPEMTDMVWLSMFRIVSARMARHKHVLAFLVYLPLDRMDVIDRINAEFKAVADAEGVENSYGFLTPMDFGKRGILEYDYYLDHTDPEDKKRIGRALARIDPFIDELSRTVKGVKSLKHVFAQGCSRKETFLYR
jgi:hypothetical protein